MNETATLAKYAATLRYEDIPQEALARARNTLCDTVGAIIFGFGLPWSQMIVEYAKAYGPGGRSRILWTWRSSGSAADGRVRQWRLGACLRA